jgi:hypothetical protein
VAVAVKYGKIVAVYSTESKAKKKHNTKAQGHKNAKRKAEHGGSEKQK